VINTDYHVRQIAGRVQLIEATTTHGRRSARPGSMCIRGVLIQMAGTKVNAKRP
jgi:hypothetical protein